MVPICSCSNPEVVPNVANGKDFYYCRGCKTEVAAHKPEEMTIYFDATLTDPVHLFIHRTGIAPKCANHAAVHHVQYPQTSCSCCTIVQTDRKRWDLRIRQGMPKSNNPDTVIDVQSLLRVLGHLWGSDTALRRGSHIKLDKPSAV